MKHALVIVFTLVIAGCATQMPRYSEVLPVPYDRVYAFQNTADGDTTVVVTRDKGFIGSACYFGLFVDGELVAKLETGERVRMHLPHGRHRFGTWTVGRALCGDRPSKDRSEIDVTLKPGETRFYRILVDKGGIDIRPTAL